MEETPAYFNYWGKADAKDEQGPTWHPFAYHSLDVAAVAAALWEQSPTIRRTFASAFSVDLDHTAALRAWVLFFVALHDIGKLHALFLIKAPEAAALAWPELDPAMVKRHTASAYDHGHEGFRLVKQELTTWIGNGDQEPRRIWRRWRPWIAAVTGHHGDIPGENEEGRPPREYAEPVIANHDTNARRSWVEQMATLFLVPAGLCLTDSPPVSGIPARNLLAGFCSLCDWIGSNAEHFHYMARDAPESTYFETRLRQIADQNLLTHLGLLAPASPYAGLSSLLQEDEKPRGIQVMVDALPLAAGLTLIEAPTGSGKTEAALAHAWRLLGAGLGEAIVFALPTQATANAMLTRAESFGRYAFGPANVVLAHGNRALNPEFQRLVDAGRHATAQGREEAGMQCAAWLASSRKKVFLGQIGVCTVDQTLLSVLPVRHSFVRGFGLNRSVLIVDEVHAYDAYMNGLLGEVLRRQKATGGSAILLSATLPAAVRAELLAAWGTEGSTEAPYPALWTTQDPPVGPLTVPDEHRPPERTVSVELAKRPDAFPDPDLIERIVAAAAAGALVGIVMNTVDQAQRLTQLLREATDLPVDLFHARFRLRDRQTIEKDVIARYGRYADRHHGRILVATQVIEQSLDLDFDWLLSQLCPVDLLFQRLGRLHRHERSRPPGFPNPACTVLCPEGEDYGVHELIYGDARLLWRTEHLLAERGQIEFPAAYRDWIEKVYAEEPWDDESDTAYGKHLAWRNDQRAAAARALQLSTMTLSQFRDDDERATGLTRDGEMSLTVLPLLDDGRLLDGTSLSVLDDHGRAEALLLNAVPAPRSWEKSLKEYAFDDDGRTKLPVGPTRPGAWASADGRFAYSAEFGLEKVAATGQEDPSRAHPR
ncbi:CRISPR-associated helicase/endonuclease Cas3 [uncultured Thiodictyon sp.]|uniref:CRISPR-associated helicase/endonuclease Cas3 n=1 Tax=uncultured Thiodictyon sp. TaxID=1846217 RepID=UPI0025D6EEBD|nr:CRISPR-associated helicase/endonuclease Cas3 [uncultured Thiodictyon sp.]